MRWSKRLEAKRYGSPAVGHQKQSEAGKELQTGSLADPDGDVARTVSSSAELRIVRDPSP